MTSAEETTRPLDILARACELSPLVTAVVHPCDPPSLEAALVARDRGLIDPILIGPREKILAAAAAGGLDLAGVNIDSVPHSHAAAARAVELVRRAEAHAIMKGSLHTDELM